MPSTVSVALLPSLLPAAWSNGQPIAIVIDTLRFTSTACVALAAGAKAITVVSDIERARELAASGKGNARLCGERHCVRIEGFDFGNSPAEYTREAVLDRELIFSTTNGTVAVEAAEAASEMLLGSLLNRAAICQWLQAWTQTAQSVSPPSRHVWLVCAGTDGHVALEDVLTAGAIIDHMQRSASWASGNDAALLALDAWQSVVSDGIADANNAPGAPELAGDTPRPVVGADTRDTPRPVYAHNTADASNAHRARTLAGDTPQPIADSILVARLKQALGGRNLIEAGFADDVGAVALLDSLDIVPRRTAAGRFEK